MEHKGRLEEHSPFEVFAYVAGRRADGVIYFRSDDGLSAFVTVKDGVPSHCGGTFGEGDAAIVGVTALAKGLYSYVEDITTDLLLFPKNITPELVEILTSGRYKSASGLLEALGSGDVGRFAVDEGRAEVRGPVAAGPVILPAGRPVERSEYESADPVEVMLNLAGLGLSGLLEISSAGARSGLYVFERGERSAGYVTAGGKTFFGGEGVTNTPIGCEYRFFELSDEIVPVYGDAVHGSNLVVRTAAAAVNPEEFIKWAVETGKSCIIATSSPAGAANIIIVKGEVIGAVTPMSPEINREIDDALAIYYAPDSEVEVFG